MAEHIKVVPAWDATFEKSSGEIAFDASYQFLENHGRGPDGELLLCWKQLSPEVQDAWQAAANAVSDMRKSNTSPFRMI